MNLDNSRVKYRLIKKRFLSKIDLKENDLLIEKSGGSTDQPVGRIAIITQNIIKNNILCYSNFIHKIRVDNKKINPKYLQWLLKTELLLLYFEKKYKTMGTVRAVNKVDIVELNVKIPERKIQDEMAKIIISLEEEEEETIKYLKIKRKYIEERMIENNQVIVDEE